MTINDIKIAVLIFLFSFLFINISFSYDLKVLSSNYNELTLRYSNDSIIFEDININNSIYKLPVIEKSHETTLVGAPYQKYLVYRINLPINRKPNYTLSDFKKSIINSIQLAPYPNIESDGIDLKKSYSIGAIYFSPEIKTFEINDFFEISDIGIAGDKYFAELRIYPYLYDSKNSNIVLLNNLNISFKFDRNYTPIKHKSTFNYVDALNYNDTPLWGVDYSFNSNSNGDRLLNGETKMSELSTGNWVKIEVNKQGIYKIDASELKNLGFDISSNDINTIKIFGIGGEPLSEKIDIDKISSMPEQEIIVNRNSDNTLNNIIFYAAGPTGFRLSNNGKIKRYNNYYTFTVSYLLTWGGTDGKRASELAVPDKPVDKTPSTYTERYMFEEELINPHSFGGGREWFGRTYLGNPFTPVMLHNLDRSGTILYRFSLAQYSWSVGKFSILENNQEIGSINVSTSYRDRYKYADRVLTEIKVPADKIASDSRSVLKFNFINQNDLGATSYFDYYEIHYPRSLVAIENSINIIPETSESGVIQYNINGFENQIYGFDVSIPSSPKLLKNNSNTGGIFSFVSEKNLKEFKSYYISSNLNKATLSKTEVGNLRDNNDKSEIVVITHPDLLVSANKYADFRREQGRTVSLFSTDQIYNEFASGNPDVTAIRDFLTYLKVKWEGHLDYVVLWGDGHYDFRNISTKLINYIPAYQTYVEDLNSFDEVNYNYATDDFYANLLGNDKIADVRIGRVIVENPEQGSLVFEKLKNYETQLSKDNFRTNLLLIADDSKKGEDGYDGSRHVNDTEVLFNLYIKKAVPEFQDEKLYIVEYKTVNVPGGERKPDATNALINKINTSGSLIVNYLGHGNPRLLAHEQLLNRDIDIPKMSNNTKPFFFTAATCDYGRFDDYSVRSGAEEMFLHPNGGAIGVLSATRVVMMTDNAILTNKFYSFLLKRDSLTGEYPSLGDAMYRLKLDLYGDNDRKYFLIGDPVMKLAIPENYIQLDSINNVAIDKVDTVGLDLKALSEVTIVGSIYDKLNHSLLENFDGYVTLTMKESEKSIFVLDKSGMNEDEFRYRKPGSTLINSTFKVEKGKFIAKFIIPKDISFSQEKAKIYTYAYSDNNHYAKGYFDKLYVRQFDSSSSVIDNNGPEIKLYMDSRKFKEHDVVSSTPLLIIDMSDESGLNTSGLGIGHKMEAWLDSNVESIDLTEHFVASFDNPKSGTINYLLPNLSEGTHRIKFRAWDVFNNYSIVEKSFIIKNNELYLGETFNYPNPFVESTIIRFRHNAQINTAYNVKIYTINSELIRELKSEIKTNYENEIVFDGYDSHNNQLPSGVYIYKVEILNRNGNISYTFGKIIKLNK